MIFCVEDDRAIRDLMTYALNSVGYQTKSFTDSPSLFHALKKERPLLILLDIMLPEEDGLEILKRLKKNSDTADIPVIMATAKGTEYDKVIGLDLGADDYLAKPFGMMEMISRVRAVLRRSTAKENTDILRFGDLILNRREHTVSASGIPLALTLKEYNILALLMEHPGRVFTRELLIENIWDLNYVGETRTVDVHINTLRTKLGHCGNYIKTVRGVGYRMEETK